MSRAKILFTILTAAFFGELNAQDWIPKGAKICFRTQYEDGFLPDADFRLKLKISKTQFEVLVKTLGVTPHTEARKYTDDKAFLSWSPEDTQDPFATDKKTGGKPPKAEMQWDPQPDLATTFVKQHGHHWEFLKFEGGYLYYRGLSH